jgi:ADP-ribose pyrophosphatase
VTLLEDHLQRTESAPVETWHAFELADYVTVLGLTADGRVPLVRQYRPALEAVTVELPGGLAEPDEAPRVTALRELEEETGWTAAAPLVDLGVVATDTGRLANRLHAFLATGLVPVDGWAPEPGVEAFSVAIDEFRRLAFEDRVLSGLHLGVIALALMQAPGPLARLLAR